MRLPSLLKWVIGFSVISVILAGCGDTNNAQQANNQNTNPEPTEVFRATDAPTLEPSATPTPVLPPPTAIPLEQQLSDLPAGQYSLSLLGTLNSDIGFTPFDSGLTGVEYSIAPNGSNLNGPYEFALWTDILNDGTSDDTTAKIVFTLPASASAGTYNVVAQDAMTTPDDIGVEIVTGFGTQRFATNATGTLTIIANGGAAGVFTGEFEVTVGDNEGNTILATGRASAIGFLPEENGELTLSGALEVIPTSDELLYTLVYDASTAANNDWRLDITTINTQTNPYIIQHRIYMKPNIAAGTYDIVPRVSALDARPEDLDATAYVELFNPTDGTRIEGTDVSGTLTVLPIRDSFSATVNLTYMINDGQQVTAEAGVFYLLKPAR